MPVRLERAGIRRCLAVGALTAAVGLVLAGLASAAYAPRLVVSGSSPSLGGRGSTTIDLRQEPGDDPTARIVVYSPPGYSARLSRPPGTAVGRVLSATAEAAGAPVELAGSLLADDPARYALDPQAQACAPGLHEAVWRVDLGGGDVRLSIPLFVDTVGSSEPEAAFASYRIQACPGAKLPRLALRLDKVFRNPRTAGSRVWRGLFTPAAGAGPPSPSATVESRSLLPLPARLVLQGRYSAKTRAVTLTGSLRVAGDTLARQSLSLWGGRRPWILRRSGLARTDGRGVFRVRKPIDRTGYFRAFARIPASDVTAAGCPSPIAPGGCVSVTRSPFTVWSDAARVVVPRMPASLTLGSRGAAVRELQAQLIRFGYLPAAAVSGLFDARTWHAVVAFQGWQRLPRTGAAGPGVWKALAAAGRPRAWGRLRDGVQIDLGRQVLLLVRGGRVVRTLHVSTGAFDQTPRGRFRIYRKELLSWSIPFRTWMPYASYFVGGFALHEYADVPAHPASHGCVRIPAADARSVYAFAQPGTPVWVR